MLRQIALYCLVLHFYLVLQILHSVVISQNKLLESESGLYDVAKCFMYIYHKQCNVKSYYVTSESHCANGFHRNLKQDLTFKHVINAIFIKHNGNHKLLAVQLANQGASLTFPTI